MRKQEAIDYYGSVTALADALGIAPQAVSQWSDTVPLHRQYQLQVITDGALQADVVPGKSDRRHDKVAGGNQ